MKGQILHVDNQRVHKTMRNSHSSRHYRHSICIHQLCRREIECHLLNYVSPQLTTSPKSDEISWSKKHAHPISYKKNFSMNLLGETLHDFSDFLIF